MCTRTGGCAFRSCTHRGRTSSTNRKPRRNAGARFWGWKGSSSPSSRCSRTRTTSPRPISTRRSCGEMTAKPSKRSRAFWFASPRTRCDWCVGRGCLVDFDVGFGLCLILFCVFSSFACSFFFCGCVIFLGVWFRQEEKSTPGRRIASSFWQVFPSFYFCSRQASEQHKKREQLAESWRAS